MPIGLALSPAHLPSSHRPLRPELTIQPESDGYQSTPAFNGDKRQHSIRIADSADIHLKDPALSVHRPTRTIGTGSSPYSRESVYVAAPRPKPDDYRGN